MIRRPLLLLAALSAAVGVGGFAPSPGRTVSFSMSYSSSSSLSLSASSSSSSSTDVLVISPPGGVGELTVVESARLGGSVKWFVVSAPSSSSASSNAGTRVSLTSETLAAIEKSGGSVELAGAAADDLLSPPNEDGTGNGALSAVASWCPSPKSLVCTYDGALEEKRRADRTKTAEQLESSKDEAELIMGAVKLAAREASGGVGKKVALLGAGEEADVADEEENGGGGFLRGLFGGDGARIPKSLVDALGGKATAVVRHGELFGAPESSPESSPFMGGPRRDPVVRDMYTTRSVRVDPSVSSSGNVLSSGGDGSRTNRLALGEAAARLALGKIAVPIDGIDVSLSSYAGTEAPTDEEWEAEFARVAETLSSSSSSSGGAPRLFGSDFASVPSTSRLAEWIATKWAPAILRSYDIAGTRVGARPVYALQTDEDKVEIVWQELVNFESVTSGRMLIEVGEGGMTAYRGAGDASKGFGSISSTPLPGEDILVRRLADAASQAVEKGLAVKPQLAKKSTEPAKKPVTTVVAASVASPQAEPAAASASGTSSSGPGPRSAGARRSSERSRGSRRRKSPGGES